MNFLRDTSTPEQVLAHLQECDASFVPPLSQRVVLPAYAEKLCRRARRLEAWENTQLVGLVALYADNAPDGGFISNVSVLPTHRGRGVAGQLLEQAIALATQLHLPCLRLEVHADNAVALTLYGHHRFIAVQPPNSATVTLTREIP